MVALGLWSVVAQNGMSWPEYAYLGVFLSNSFVYYPPGYGLCCGYSFPGFYFARAILTVLASKMRGKAQKCLSRVQRRTPPKVLEVDIQGINERFLDAVDTGIGTKRVADSGC